MKIKNLLNGEVVRIDEQDRNGKYPTGYGRLVEVKTNKKIMVDGKPYTLFVHYAHATPDSFSNIEVGDNLEVGQEIGKIGGTGKWAAEGDRYSPHLDIRGYIWVDGKRVHVSPSEFMPMGPEEHRRRKGYKKGGEVKKWSDKKLDALIPKQIQVDPKDYARSDRHGDRKPALRPVSKVERHQMKELLKSYDDESVDQIKRWTKNPWDKQQLFSEMASEIEQEERELFKKPKKKRAKLRDEHLEEMKESDIEKQMDTQGGDDFREFQVDFEDEGVATRGGRKWTRDPRRAASEGYTGPDLEGIKQARASETPNLKHVWRDPEGRKAPIRQVGRFGKAKQKFRPFMMDPSFVDRQSKEYSELRGEDLRQYDKDVSRHRKAEPYLATFNPRDEQDRPLAPQQEWRYKEDYKDWYEQGGKPWESRETTVHGDRELADVEYRGKKVGPVETDFEKLERYAMQYGKDSDEFKDLISTMPRDLSNIPEVIEKDLWGERKAYPRQQLRKHMGWDMPSRYAPPKGYQEGGEVEEDAWLREYSAPTDDLGQQYADFRSGEGEGFQEDVEVVTPFTRQIEGYEGYVEMPQNEVGPSPAQQKVADAKSALKDLDKKREEKDK